MPTYSKICQKSAVLHIGRWAHVHAIISINHSWANFCAIVAGSSRIKTKNNLVPNYYSEKLVIKISRCLTTVQCRQREIFVYFARCAAFHVHTNITIYASSDAFLAAMWTLCCLTLLRFNWSLHGMLQTELKPQVPRVGPGPKVPNETIHIVLDLLKHLLRRR